MSGLNIDAHASFELLGYKLPATWITPEHPNPGFLLWLYGSRSNRAKHQQALENFADQLNLPVVCFDYSGHGESPFEFEQTTPAQHALEVITIYDQLTAKYGCDGGFTIGASYGSFLSLQLLKYRKTMASVLRAPALHMPRDFYTRLENIDQVGRKHFVSDKKAVLEHPLLARASSATSPVLIVEHDEDEEIPKVLIEAIREKMPSADYYLEKGIPHSLSRVSKERAKKYEQRIIDWLKQV